MLALCREKGEREGLAPALYQQAAHEIDLPRAYRTIMMCGTFGIGGYREHDAEALRRCYAHLAPGGMLVFDHELPYHDANQWQHWLPEKRKMLPDAASDSGMRKRAADGDEIELRGRLVDLDPLEQRLTMEILPRLWRGEDLIAEEAHTFQSTLYFRNEILLMLANAGFRDIRVLKAFADEPPAAEDTTIVFVARKSSVLGRAPHHPRSSRM
jgi:hypothetical protein